MSLTNKIGELLKRFEANAVDSTELKEDDLSMIFKYLMDIPSSTRYPNGSEELHWFCSIADNTTREAATFLIRLKSYNGEPAKLWESRLDVCLSSCPKCVQGFEGAKIASRKTYLAAFPENLLDQFFQQFESSEKDIVLSKLNAVLLTAGNAPLSALPSPVVYRTVMNWTIFTDTLIQGTFQSCPPADLYSSWPVNPLPPGIFVFLLHKNDHLRKWATSLAGKSSLVSHEGMVGSYPQAMALVSSAIQPLSDLGPNSSDDALRRTLSQTSNYLFADGVSLWSGIEIVLRLLPPEWLKSTPRYRIDLRRLIIERLRDRAPHFPGIFKCFLLLLKRLGKEVWSGDENDYPLVTFDSIKDNPSFIELLQKCDSGAMSSPAVACFMEYLLSLNTSPSYEEILAKVVRFLLEEAQHERFYTVRPAMMQVGLNILLKEVKKQRSTAQTGKRASVFNLLDIHAETIVSVAYVSSRQQMWNSAREQAQLLVKTIFALDIETVCSSIKFLNDIFHPLAKDKPYTGGVPPLTINKILWTRFQETLEPSNTKAIADAVLLMARTAHIFPLDGSLFKGVRAPSNVLDLLDRANESLTIFRNGFSNAVSRFTDFHPSSAGLDFLRMDSIGNCTTILLFSPVPDCHTAAENLVGLAYDVDGRLESFRALLEHQSGDALDGIFTFLAEFTDYVSKASEACKLFAQFLPCFTDILNILCARPHGLLQSVQFLCVNDDKGPAARILGLWKTLVTALSEVFHRAIGWALYYHKAIQASGQYALMLGRDLLEQWMVLETAANMWSKAKAAPTGQLSPIGVEMIQTLQLFLSEASRWLRLTDEELLHQSFTLIESLIDLMEKYHIRPTADALGRLRKLVFGPSDKHRLDSARLAKLTDIVQRYDEPVVVEPPKIKPKQEPKGKQPEEVKEPPVQRPYIQGKPKQSTSAAPVQSKLGFKSTTVQPKFQYGKLLAEDQRKLDTVKSLPTFRKGEPSSSALPTSKPRKAEPKNEALAVAVESDDSSSDSDEGSEVEGVIKNLGRIEKVKSPVKPKPPPPPRQIKTLELGDLGIHSKPRFQPRRETSQRDRAARIKPNVSGLHKALLSWNYDDEGPMPPGDKFKLSRAPDSFNSYDQFFSVFEPLLLVECWAQLQQSKEERQDSYTCIVESRRYIDSWVEISVNITESVRNQWYLTETDVILLENPQKNKRLMAKVVSYKSMPRIEAVIRCNASSGDGASIQTQWQLRKLFSLSTLHREYGALVSLRYNGFCNFIMQPSLKTATPVEERDIRETMATYNVNEPQASAILKVMATEGFSLVQGPPGTGKTSTICGLVARFMAKRRRPAVPVVAGQSKSNAPPVESKSRVLLCAPSNAAIDEIANRIKDGYIGPDKRKTAINVVRIGAEQAIGTSTRDISLEALVNQKLEGSGTTVDAAELEATKTEIEATKQRITAVLAEIQNTQDTDPRKLTLQQENERLQSKRKRLREKQNQLRDNKSAASRMLDMLRRNARLEVLNKADVICCTLSGSGHESLESLEFNMIIIDEAAQAIEPSTLIPLKYDFTRCVMVGDPQQLPPTVISQEATRFGYNQSLFVRLQKSRPSAVHLLSIQYRMHPEISLLPSSLFYNKQLLDGPDMDKKTARPWHNHSKFGTYKFFNIPRSVEEQSGRSIKNSSECQVAIALYNRLQREFASFDFKARIGIVSMYRAQIVELRRLFEQRFGKDIKNLVDFNTVDGFQGQEKDIIILSCVRGGPGLQSVGFLSDVRRMNVALTRAKSSLFIIGNAPTLERSDDVWRQIVSNARARSALVDVDTAYFTAANTSSRAEPPPAKRPRLEPKAMEITPLPADLFTPKQYKAMAEGSPMTGILPPPVISAEPQSIAGLDPVTKPQPVAGPSRVVDSSGPLGLKRPHPVDSDEAFKPEAKPKPRPQARKRPKVPEEQILFRNWKKK